MLAYTTCNLNDLQLEIKKDGLATTKKLILGGSSFNTTDRFWGSISSRFGLNQKLFKFFTPEEVLTRVMEVSKKDRKGVALRLVTDDKNVYGTSDPRQKILTYDEVKAIYDKNGIDFNFVDGQLQSFVTPDGGAQSFKIGADDYNHRFFLRSPVDGYGNHTGALALLRQICENGMIAMAPAFTTILKIGNGEKKDMGHGLQRAINSFSNSDGFTVLEHRVEVAQKSTASLAEVIRIKKTIGNLSSNNDLAFIDEAINEATGHVLQRYGVTDLRQLGKKTKVLPANCTVHELMNVLTEAATHNMDDKVRANKVHALVGDLLSVEYDLEGTKSKFSEFQDLYFKDKKIA